MFTEFNPVAVAITMTVLTAQIAAFWKTLALANNMRRSFDVTEVTVHLSDVSTVVIDGTASFPRLQITQKPKSRSASNLVATVNSAVGAADSLSHQIRTFRETVSSFVEAGDEHATTIANVPVYLGLMGTFAGIMAGVLQIVIRGGLSERSIRDLLGGVIVAMFASFIGLALMTISNAIVLPGARTVRDRRMAEYVLSFESQADRIAIQIDKPMAELAERQFLLAVQRLTESFERFSHSIQSQQVHIQALERMDLPQLASLNARMLKELPQLLDKINGIARMDLPSLAASNARLAEELPRLIKSVGEMATMDVPGLIDVNSRLLEQLPRILQGISEIEKTSIVVAQRFTSFQIGEMNISAVLKDVGTLPAILEVLREMRSQVTERKTTPELSDNISRANEDQDLEASRRGAHLACFVVFGVGICCLLGGMLRFPGTYFGASLGIGGGLLAYEAGYVFFFSQRRRPF